MFSVQQNILGGEKCFSYLLCEAIQNGFVSFEINVFPGKIAKHSLPWKMITTDNVKTEEFDSHSFLKTIFNFFTKNAL